MSSLKKNLGYQTFYQILATCLPLVTSPYISRVLGAKQLGVYSYTNSITLYFTLFAMLGTVNYGTRSIAAVRDDEYKKSKVFWSIFSLQFICSLISFFAYGIYLIAFCKENKLIALLQGITIINCMLDINWFFFGLEEFKLTVTRNIIVKVCTVTFLFIFVRSQKDLWIYTLLMSGSTVVSQLFLWSKVKKYCKFVKISFHDIGEHIKPNFTLFIPLLAVSVYHIMDKTMLGIMSTDEQSGFYYNADKLINMPLVILNGFGTVMLPRITNLMQKRDDEKAVMLFKVSLEGIIALGCAMAFGIASVADRFVPFFFGDKFGGTISIAIILAPVLIFKGISNTVRTEYLIPYHLEKDYTSSVLAGAATNLTANILLIPRLGGEGAALGTLVAEIISCVWQVAAIVNRTNMKAVLLRSLAYVFFGIMMLFTVHFIIVHIKSDFLAILIGIVCGVTVYAILCVLLWKRTNNPFGFISIKKDREM